jgi:hypothetical protein
MSDHETSAGGEARKLQSVIAAAAQRSQGRSLDEAIDLLQVGLTMAGLQAPTTTWLDAVAREAVAGRVYVVATDALLLDLDQTPESQALQDAPADLTMTCATAAPNLPTTTTPAQPSEYEATAPDASMSTARVDGAPSLRRQPVGAALNRSALWAFAGLAGLALILMLGDRRRKSAKPKNLRPLQPGKRHGRVPRLSDDRHDGRKLDATDPLAARQ